MKLIAILIALLVPFAAQAQTGTPVKQSGSVTPGHALVWVTNGIARDAGTAAQGFITSLGVTTSGPGICQNSAAITTAYNQICLGVTSLSATLSVTNQGGASGGLTLSASSYTFNGLSGCLQASNAGVISGTGSVCSGGGGGAVSSVSNSDGSLTILPITGSVVAALNVGNANTWNAVQTFNSNDIALLGSSSGATTFASANPGASNFTLTFPAVTATVAVLSTNQTFSATQTFSGTLNVSGTFQLNGTAVALPITVTNGGTAQNSFTANLPLIGNGTSAIGQGTRSGNTTTFGTTSGALANGDCVSIDANGNLVDALGPCTTGGGGGTVSPGTANQLAYYQTTSSTVVGLITCNSGVYLTSGAGVPSCGTTIPATTQANITSLGTVATGVWHGTVIGATYGGTGVNNGANTITVGGNLSTSAALSLPTVAQGDTWYGSAAGTISALAKNTTATRYLSNTGTSNNPAWAQIDLTNGVTGNLPLTNGGTNASLVASNGGIVYSTASAFAVLSGTATSGRCLLSGSNTAPSWSACPGGSVSSVSNVDGTLTISPTTGAVIASLNLGNTNSWTGDQLFGSGRPWCDVRAQGAKGDAATDDSAAFAACRTILTFGGGNAYGTIYVPVGNGGARYCLFSGFAMQAGDSLILEGEASIVDLSTCNHNGVTLVTLSGLPSQIRNFTLFGYGGLQTEGVSGGSVPSNPALLIQNCSNGCLVQNIITYGGSRGLELRCGANDVYLDHMFVTLAYNNSLAYEGCASGAIGAWWNRVQLDQTAGSSGGYGSIAGTLPPAWASSHSYAANAVVSSNGYYFQTAAGGTSGGTPPTLHSYNSSFSDGGVSWLLLAPTSFYALLLDSYSNQNFFRYMDFDGPYTNAIISLNTLSAAAPTLTTISDSNAGATFGDVFDLQQGNGFSVVNSTFGACLSTSCIAIHTEINWQGDVRLSANWIHDGAYGVDAGAPASHSNLIVVGNIFTDWTQVAFNVGNSGDVQFIGNSCVSSNTYGGVVAKCWNIAATTYYQVIGNNYHGTTNAPTPTNQSNACGVSPITSCVVGNIGQ